MTKRILPLLALLGSCHSPFPYHPRVRLFTVTTVPLLSRELAGTYPFLKQDFARGGMLEGKEVYAFVPSTLVAYAGDTLEITLVNPEDDAHTFVLPDFAAAIPGQSTKTIQYVAGAAGIYPFRCNLTAHAPMMSGELVVLAR